MTRVLLPFDRIADESSEPRGLPAPTTISSLRRMHTFVGPKVKVGRGASLSGAVALRGVCLVSDGATVKQSVLLLDSSLGSGAYLEDCIVGPTYEVWVGEWILGEPSSVNAPKKSNLRIITQYERRPSENA